MKWIDHDEQYRQPPPPIITRVIIFILAIATIPYWIGYGAYWIFNSISINRITWIFIITLGIAVGAILAGLIGYAIIQLYIESKP